MLDFKVAKSILKDNGYSNDRIEPILVDAHDGPFLFVTLKTEYGHLSRALQFDDVASFKSFLKLYGWYKENLNSENIIVSFDNYEDKNPKVTFLVDGEKLTEEKLNGKKEFENIEVLDVDTTEEDMQLFDMIKEKINIKVSKINSLERELEETIEELFDKQKKYREQTKQKVIDKELVFDKTDSKKYLKDLDEIIKKYTDDKLNFIKYFEEAIKVLESISNDSNYINNSYLNKLYREEINRLILKLQRYNEYLKQVNPKKNNKHNDSTFAEYLKNNPVYEKEISKESIEDEIRVQTATELIELRNNDIEDLKIIYNKKEEAIEPKEIIEQDNDITTIDIEDLNTYFMGLNNEERNISLMISSPIKELLNMLDDINLNNGLNEIKKEKYYFVKFREMYEILASQDNFAATLKYLKLLKIDSIDEFIESVISIKKRLNIKKYKLPINVSLKYKIGVFMKKGLINASLGDEYPVNNKGINRYSTTRTRESISIYYAPYFVYLNSDDILENRKNDSIITFDMDGYKVNNKTECVVNNYMLKNQKDIVIFNTKIYCSNELVTRNGDENE